MHFLSIQIACKGVATTYFSNKCFVTVLGGHLPLQAKDSSVIIKIYL